MRFDAHALRAWIADRRLGRQQWVRAQITALAWLGRGTLLLVALVVVLGDQADQAARAKGLMPVQAQLPAFVGAHSCMSPADEEPPAPEPVEEPPCPRKMQGARR
jgi:hypothetical protein